MGPSVVGINLDTNLKMQTPKQGMGRLEEGSLDWPALRTPGHQWLQFTLIARDSEIVK